MYLGQKGFNLITNSEAFKPKAYLDQGNVWTIGWGTTSLNGMPVTEGMELNELTGRALFMGNIKDILLFLTLKFNPKTLNQNQIDALCSLAYNIGLAAFEESSLYISIKSKLIINEDLFTRWNKVRDPKTKQLVVSNGLTKRRKKEFNLYMDEII